VYRFSILCADFFFVFVYMPVCMGTHVLKALRTRRSIGKLDDRVSDEQIRTMIEAAVWAPNHRLTEPWRFTVLRGAARERLGCVWAEIAAKRTELQGEEREAFLRRERGKPMRAPALIVVSTRTDPDPIVAVEDFAATAAAVQNLLLAAQELGLGSMWRTGELAYAPEVKEHLGLSLDDRIVAIVYVGKPAMEPPKARLRESERNVRWLT
jgi:nitroreductase